jgi:hypothetical protein
LITARLILAITLASAQTGVKGSQDVKSALAAAQSSAIRSGDESLGCEVLQKEFVANLNSPTVQSYVAKIGTEAQKQQNALSAAKPQIGGQAALSTFASLAPGGGWQA